MLAVPGTKKVNKLTLSGKTNLLFLMNFNWQVYYAKKRIKREHHGRHEQGLRFDFVRISGISDKFCLPTALRCHQRRRDLRR
jgi:hypothetical protein